jgi:mannosyl-oligosaccharide alpha-1,2-mannosidase
MIALNKLSNSLISNLPTRPPKWSMYTQCRQRRLEKYLVAAVSVVCLLWLLEWSISSSAAETKIQFAGFEGASRSYVQSARRRAVKKEFLHAWDGYRDHSWMADGLLPLSGGRRTQFCSWSATLVDALDSLWIMGLEEQFRDAVNATMTIDFRSSAEMCEVNVFESTIRYLGGLLGAFDLSGEERLLVKLVEVGDMLLGAFRTVNGMPCNVCHLAGGDEILLPSDRVALADVGSLYLEFSRLSQITGDPKYQQAVEHVAEVFQRTSNDSSIPGLWPEFLDASSIPTQPGDNGTHAAKFARNSVDYSLGALSDSTYEYLLKGHMMLGGATGVYKQMWHAASTRIKNLMLFRAHIPDISTPTLFSGIISRQPNQPEVELEPRTQHLACFAGGMFAIASKVFDTAEDFEVGKQLTEGCVWAYQHSPTGLMPETFTLAPCSELNETQCAWNETAFSAYREECLRTGRCTDPSLPPGWLSVGDPKYALRPEAIESVFVMWRMTGDEHWRDIGWSMFQHIIHHTRTPFGHSAVASVLYQSEADMFHEGVLIKTMRAPQADDMESFWFAETLKYFYLLFSDVDLISLDDFVLNTEAHPLRLTPGLRGF